MADVVANLHVFDRAAGILNVAPNCVEFAPECFDIRSTQMRVSSDPGPDLLLTGLTAKTTDARRRS